LSKTDDVVFICIFFHSFGATDYMKQKIQEQY